MNIIDCVGKRCLLAKNVTPNCPEEVLIEAISDDKTFFKMKHLNGFSSWYRICEYVVIDTLNKMSLNEYINDTNKQTQLLFD